MHYNLYNTYTHICVCTYTCIYNSKCVHIYIKLHNTDIVNIPNTLYSSFPFFGSWSRFSTQVAVNQRLPTGTTFRDRLQSARSYQAFVMYTS